MGGRSPKTAVHHDTPIICIHWMALLSNSIEIVQRQDKEKNYAYFFYRRTNEIRETAVIIMAETVPRALGKTIT